MNKKKLLALLMALVMTLSLMPVTAFAEEGNVAKIGSTEYETLQAAIAAANDDDTVTLIGDASGFGENGIQVPTNLTLDLNGHKIDNGNYMIMAVSSGKRLVIKDETGKGKIISKYSEDGAFAVWNGGSLVLQGGTVINNEGCPFGTMPSASVEIAGGKVVTNNSVVITPVGETAALTVSGGEIEASKLWTQGWFGGSVSVTIEGGSFKGGVTTNSTATAIGNNPVASGLKVVQDGDWYKVVSDVPNVAKIGSAEYATLAAAIAAVPANGEATTITMIADEMITGNAGATVPANKNVILDLNGKTITGVITENASSAVLTVAEYGALTICDNSQNQVGLITHAKYDESVLVGNWSAQNWQTDIIFNHGGTLTIEGGTIANTANGNICYAIDSSNNYRRNDATLTITGGTITSQYCDTIRMRLDDPVYGENSGRNVINISGGTISGRGGIWAQVSSGTAPKGSLTITGGTITGVDWGALTYSAGSNVSIADFSASISGGKIAGSVGLPQEKYISGGVFSLEINENKVVEGKTPILNTDAETMGAYPYTVGVAAQPVAEVNGTPYTTLEAAINAANAIEAANVTINLQADCEVGSTFNNGAPLALTKANTVLNLNNHTITVNKNFSFVMAADNITVQNGKIYSADNAEKETSYNSYVLVIGAINATDSITGVRVVNVETHGGVSVGGSSDAGCKGGAVNVVLKDCNITSGDYYAVCSQNQSTVTIESGTYISNDDIVHPKQNNTSAISPNVLHAAFKGADGPEGNIYVTGGNFKGAISDSNAGWIVISGGYFSVAPADGMIAPGYEVIDNPDTSSTYGWTIGVINGAFKEVKNTAEEPVTHTNTNTNTAFSFATTTENTDDVTYAIKTTTTGGQDPQVAYTPVQTDIVTKPSVSQDAAKVSGVENEDKVAEVKTAVENSAASGTTKIQAKEQGVGSYGDVNLLTTQAAANAITSAAAAYTGAANNIAKVEIQLQTKLTSYTLADEGESVVTTALIYQVTPKAVLLDASGQQLSAETLTNDDLKDQNLALQFRLPVPESAVTDSNKVIVTHRSNDSNYEDSTSLLTVQQDEAGNHFVVIETTHFSEFELTPYVVDDTNQLITASLTLGGSIDLNFYLKLKDDVTAVRFTYRGTTTTVSRENGSYDSVQKRYKFSIPVAAKDIYKDVTIELLNEDNATQAFSFTYHPDSVANKFTYSVAEYVNYVKVNGKTDAEKALANSLGTYGYYANLHLLKGEEHDKYNTVSDSYDTTIINFKNDRYTTGTNPISGSGMTLLLRSETVIAYRFDENVVHSGYKFYFTHSYTYDDGGYAENVEYEAYPVHTGNYWYVESKGIPAAYLDKGVTFKIVSGDNVEEYRTTYSPMIYGGSMLSKNTTSDTLKDTIRAMYDYYLKASAYFNINN